MPPITHPRDLDPHPENQKTPVNMTDQKNSHKGGRAGARVSVEANEGKIEKNKARIKYGTSIPLQEYQTLVRSNNLDSLRAGTGNNPRCGSRAPSEVSDPDENDVSLTNPCIQSDKIMPPDDSSIPLNPHKRRAMEEEDGLAMENRTTSRPATPSMGYEVNKTPKVKSRIQPPYMTHHQDTMDEDPLNMGGYQDLLMTTKEESTCDCINMKLDDTLEELILAKQSLIWTKLDFVEQWLDHVTNVVGSTRGSDMDKHIISNLAETNAYLTRKIVELELKDMNFSPESIQPHQTQEPPPAKKITPAPSQPSWAQVATDAHQEP